METQAPAGYNLKAEPVEITVTNETDTESADYGSGSTLQGVSYEEGTSLSSSGGGKKYDADAHVYTLLISDTAGYALPSTGGSGTGRIYLFGILLIALVAAGMFAYKKS